jgi:transcriptional regulator with XRE-family HTH domain
MTAIMGKNAADRELGREIRRRREALGLTLEQYATRCGLTPNYIGTIENGLRDPSTATVEALAEGLGVSPGELLGATPELSAMAIEAGQLYEKATPAAQAAILEILHAITGDAITADGVLEVDAALDTTKGDDPAN